MLRDQFGHFEHRNGALAEDLAQFSISIDVALVLAVLETVLLDVSPELLHDLRARKRRGAYNFGQSSAGSQPLHESSVRLALRAGFLRGLLSRFFSGFLGRFFRSFLLLSCHLKIPSQIALVN